MPPDPVMLEVGRIAKPHGLRGEVIVELVTDRTERVAPGTVLHTPGGAIEVIRSSSHQGRWIVAFKGIDDRSAADRLRGTVLRAEALDDPDTLWIHQLIGSRVSDTSGRDLGAVASIEANPASDLLVLDGGGLIPLRFVVEHGTGRIVVDPPAGLLD